ncbi:MAG: alpha/beta hydrolase [Rhodospirillaceae bacterium]|nr:alpha/beta hydrolase [Rhodospirillaceae bacterium]
MSTINRRIVTSAGRSLSLLEGGPAREPILFLHGGAPGRSLYCSGAHLWADYLPLAAENRRAVAPDLPGFGDTAADASPYRFDAMADLALGLIEALKLGPCHIVGHDEGGLIALAAAMAAPKSVRSISIVASPAAAPTGDSIENLTLANPPGPPWSRAAQRWALERMSYNPSHIDAALLDRCVACAEGAAHRGAVALAGNLAQALAASGGKIKGAFYTLCRDGAFPVPAQLIWGSHDPMTTTEHGRVLYGVIARRQTATHFHLINRTGSFPFREEPAAFHHVLKAFHDGLAGAIL